MPSISFEASCPVNDYFRPKDTDLVGYKDAKLDAFDRVQTDSDVAITVARELLLSAGVSHYTLKRIVLTARFTECDSGNLSHAVAYFSATAVGEWKAIHRVLKALGDWYGPLEDGHGPYSLIKDV